MSTPELSGLVYRSPLEPFVLNKTYAVRNDYLLPALSRMTAPTVTGLELRFSGTVGAITGGALGRDAAKLFNLVRIRVGATDRVLASGAGLRVLEQAEFGAAQQDPTDLSSGTTNASYVLSMYIPFAPRASARPKDFHIPVSDFMNGGEFNISLPSAVPTGWNAPQSDWTVQINAFVTDDRVSEVHSARRIREELIPAQEYSYTVNGALRRAIITSALATTGYTSLASIVNINSTTLQLPSAYSVDALRRQYKRDLYPIAPTSTDEAFLATPGALHLVWPKYGQNIGRMIEMKTLHLDLLGAPPASARLITDTVIDRDANQVAAQLGYDNTAELDAAVRSMGQVRGARDNYPMGGFNAQLAKRLPYKVRTSKR